MSILCWEGQLGGFEGLRRKGWTVLNYLIHLRDALTRNTGTKFLAQRDNQILITQYSLVTKGDDQIVDREIANIWENNKAIMDRIQKATGSLCLIINNDEVVISAELLVYGKVPIYRGKMIPLETKRWSRISSVTNDQIPSFANSIAGSTTSGSRSLSVSDHPIKVIKQFHFFGSFSAALTSTFNSVLGDFIIENYLIWTRRDFYEDYFLKTRV